MVSIIEQLTEENLWKEYLDFKRKQLSTSDDEIKYLEEYIEKKLYLPTAEKIVLNKYNFSIPEKHLINKINKSKKRIVYNFQEDETMILKIITYLFSKKYDEKYSSNCYSFRRHYTVKDAIIKLTKYPNINNLYGYKVDIQNYFNSINVEILLKKLKLFLVNDIQLFELIKNILTDPRVKFNNEIIYENKGIMAGIPISSFLANIYLKEVDDFFYNKNIIYIRYSDDIIFFSDKDNLQTYIKDLHNFLKIYELTINEDKIQYINPGDQWDFLGFSFQNNIIDISNIAKKKIKGKIKRTSRKLRRWMLRTNSDSNRAISAVIRKFNRKFYMIENKKELTWQLWYFPIINTDKGLHEIDLYMQNCLRYIATGRYTKKNYNLKYEKLKKLGYRPLVSEYYKFKKGD